VPTCTKRATPAAAAARSAWRVPSIVSRAKASRGPQISTLAAACTPTAAPAMPARMTASFARSPCTGRAPNAEITEAALPDRASARTGTPRATSAEITSRPTKPEPPVRKTGVA
jgi:hypothetical protein